MNALFDRRWGLRVHAVLFCAGIAYQTWLRMDLYRGGDYTVDTHPFAILGWFVLFWVLLLLFHAFSLEVYRQFDRDWQRFAYTWLHIMRDVHIGLFLGVTSYLWALVLSVARVWGGGLLLGTATVIASTVFAVWGVLIILQQMVVFELDQRAARRADAQP